jgi:hypothetical protein
LKHWAQIYTWVEWRVVLYLTNLSIRYNTVRIPSSTSALSTAEVSSFHVSASLSAIDPEGFTTNAIKLYK